MYTCACACSYAVAGAFVIVGRVMFGVCGCLAPCLFEILLRFELAVREGRKAAMVPASGGAIGQVLGSISSALYVGTSKSPSAEEAGPASGTFAEVCPT